jgi:hypothetical protein
MLIAHLYHKFWFRINHPRSNSQVYSYSLPHIFDTFFMNQEITNLRLCREWDKAESSGPLCGWIAHHNAINKLAILWIEWVECFVGCVQWKSPNEEFTELFRLQCWFSSATTALRLSAICGIICLVFLLRFKLLLLKMIEGINNCRGCFLRVLF